MVTVDVRPSRPVSPVGAKPGDFGECALGRVDHLGAQLGTMGVGNGSS